MKMTIKLKIRSPSIMWIKKCLCNAKLRSISRGWYNLSFSNQKFSRVYGDAALFVVKFFGMDELIPNPRTPSDYNTLYPLFTFDVSNQKVKLESSVIDIQTKANLTENVLAKTRAFARLFQTRCCNSIRRLQNGGSLLKNRNIYILSTKILGFKKIQIQLILWLHTCSSITFPSYRLITPLFWSNAKAALYIEG